MDYTHFFIICCGAGGFLLIATLVALFFISRKSQKVMQSLLTIITQPERAKIADASRVLATILADEITKIEHSFQTMRDTLNAQIDAVSKLNDMLTVQNDQLVTTADDATKKIANMSGRLDNTVSGLGEIVESQSWKDVENSTDRFSNTVNELLNNVNITSQNTTQQTAVIQEQIDSWLESAKTMSENLQGEFNFNADQMKNLTCETEALQAKLKEIAQTTAEGFNNIKNTATDYETVLGKNNKQLDAYLEKLDTFGIQSKKQLTSQMNTLTNTANVVAGQTQLVETSIEKQSAKLTDIVETLMASATATEGAVRGISNELVGLTNKFDTEIKEYATGVVAELKTVSGVANATLENTKTAANAFSDSVKTMASGVRETLIEMNTAHTQLSAQSEHLIKMSSDTTAQLEPLSALIERYYAALPDLSRGSVEASETLEITVASLNEKIALMKSTVAESTDAVSGSATKLEELAGQSRQQMIDLMADYAKAVDTMQTLNKQMMVARASAPMDAIKAAPTKTFGHISSTDFLGQVDQMLAPLHEQSMDLTRVAGAEIPDIVWTKYHGGDKTIFSKWLAKMLGAADKKQIRDMIKSDAVFRRQATQFVRSFDKILTNAQQTDNPDSVSSALVKTDVGHIYIALKSYV
ncbi:MAG: methyl-accepting chemotaxis protein [Alphaproteobacteria bacterium]|nr:methyl-accepting chemotaxis protein [Alphaproteobacteria bacterium]